MRCVLLGFLLLTACDGSAGAPAVNQAQEPTACADRLFEGSRFTVCAVPGGTVEVRTADAGGQPYRSFTALAESLGEKSKFVAFAMNGGMFDEQGKPIGLLIEDGRQIKAINRREGSGNFHLMPNGVFLVRKDGSAEVVTSDSFQPGDSITFATQSGPMLVIDGALHPKFDPDGSSRHIRNGVGIGPDGTPVFAISAEPVSFGKFARLFRDSLKSGHALYFDGSVSSLWDPAAYRRDSFAPLGPIVVVFRPAA